MPSLPRKPTTQEAKDYFLNISKPYTDAVKSAFDPFLKPKKKKNLMSPIQEHNERLKRAMMGQFD